MMDLRWRPADPDLRPFVTIFLERRDCEPLGPALEFPLAVPQVQVMLGAGYRVEASGLMRPTPRSALWGSCADVRRAAPAGRLHAFVAVLTFRGAALLLGEAPRPIVGKVLDLETLATFAASKLADRLVVAPAFSARVELFQELLRGLAAGRREAADGPILDLSAAIADHRLSGSVADVARAAGLSERTLYNRLQRGIGLSPKRLLRLARLNRLLRSLHPAPWGARPPLDPLVEFFDQAHMHREFTHLTGLTPRAFAAAKARTGDRLVHCFLFERPSKADRMTG
jgi:AraC-like DNA-binding protein